MKFAWLRALWNPQMILAIVVSFGVAAAGGYWKGSQHTKDRIEAQYLRDQQIADNVYRKSLQATAEEIAKIQIVNRTIRQQLETEVRYEPVYLDCRHTDDVKRLLNAILLGEAPAESLNPDSLSSPN